MTEKQPDNQASGPELWLYERQTTTEGLFINLHQPVYSEGAQSMFLCYHISQYIKWSNQNLEISIIFDIRVNGMLISS